MIAGRLTRRVSNVATAALIALIGAGVGLQILDPVAALLISAIAVRELCRAVARRQ